MTKQEFHDWKRHPVTQQVFSQLTQRIHDLKDAIVSDASSGETVQAAHKAGAIAAYGDMLLIEFEESNGN